MAMLPLMTSPGPLVVAASLTLMPLLLDLLRKTGMTGSSEGCSTYVECFRPAPLGDLLLLRGWLPDRSLGWSSIITRQ